MNHGTFTSKGDCAWNHQNLGNRKTHKHWCPAFPMQIGNFRNQTFAQNRHGETANSNMQSNRTNKDRGHRQFFNGQAWLLGGIKYMCFFFPLGWQQCQLRLSELELRHASGSVEVHRCWVLHGCPFIASIPPTCSLINAVCVYVYIYNICMYIYIYVCMYIYICTYVNIRVHWHIHISKCMYIYICIIYIYMHYI